MEIKLGATAKAAPRARRVLDDLRELSESARDDARLLVSELVANAIYHGEFHGTDSITLETTITEGRLWVAVTNPGWSDIPHVKSADPLDTSGRGIALIESLADAWGTEMLADGRIKVWFELKL